MKVVIDTNVFVSSFINPHGAPRKVLSLWHAGEIQLCLCKEILDEYVTVLDRLGVIDQEDLRELLALFRSRWQMVFTVIDGDLQVVAADPADDKFLECALKSGADCIVSGDKHLKDLGSYRAIPVLAPADFLRAIQAPQAEPT